MSLHLLEDAWKSPKNPIHLKMQGLKGSKARKFQPWDAKHAPGASELLLAWAHHPGGHWHPRW